MSEKITLTIDGQEIEAKEGEILLWVALDNDIFIPNLCAMKEKKRPSANCRLCFVEVEGYSDPVSSCTIPVTQDMKVKTRSPEVDRLVKTAFELLLSDHRLGCSRCPANKNCELQRIAKERKLKLKVKRFDYLEKEAYFDESPDLLIYDPSRCVLCGRCVWVDHNVVEGGTLNFSYRGINRRVTTFGDKPLSEFECIEKCGECVKVCPTGALYFKESQVQDSQES